MPEADGPVGLIGLGAAGSGLALCLAESGYRLLVADARPRSDFAGLLRAGGSVADWASAEEVCRRCTTVLTSLPSVPALLHYSC